MKVIFLKALKKTAKEGEIKEVSDGYAKNYLIPNGIAQAYTEQSKKNLEINNEKHKKEEEENIKKNNEIKKKLEEEKFVFKVKAGEKNQIFGTISSKHISEELGKRGYNIDKREIVIDNPIKSLGVHNIRIVLHNKVEVVLSILVEK